MSIVWRDKVLSSYNGNIESVIVTDAGEDYTNGVFVTLGNLADGQREVKKATLATDGAGEVLLIASPEVLYESGKHIDDFRNEEEGVARAFRLADGDVITLTNDLVGLALDAEAPTVGTEFTVANGKLVEGEGTGPIKFLVREGAGYELTRKSKAVRFDIVR